MLAAVITVLLLGGVAAWMADRAGDAPRWIAVISLVSALALLLLTWGGQSPTLPPVPASDWVAELDWSWIPPFGIRFHLALDGLSLVLIGLTLGLGLAGVAASWTEIQERVGFFHFHYLWSLAGIVGVFLAIDLFLFVFFWEVMLVPMYFLVALWGHEDRARAALKFFIFTQGSGLLLLLGVLALAFLHFDATGTFSFDYSTLLTTQPSSILGFWAMLGLFVAFAVKLPAVPMHTWLPDAHTQAPTAGSVILAGVLLKTGAYGLLRFTLPLFPEASQDFAPTAMVLGVAGILYGALQAFAQDDLKRLVAYSSVSHMGFVLLGLYAGTAWALQGVVMQMVAHGISTGALFILAGSLQERLHTRSMSRMGGLWEKVPRLAAFTLLFAMAALGLPGTGNFIGEFLILLGAFPVHRPLTVLAAVGLVGAVIYALILMQGPFHGSPRESWQPSPLDRRETITLAALTVILVGLGLYPQPVLDIAGPTLNELQGQAISGEPLAQGDLP